MKLQVSVDLLSLEQAMNMLQDVAPYVDVIEAGTPLIKQEGLKVVETFKKSFPDKLIFADMKTMDAGELEAEMAFKANADFTTVLAASNDATIEGAVAAARKYKKYVVADMIAITDRAKRGQELERLGVNFIELHCGLDQQAHGLCSLSELKTIREQLQIPIFVAGGIDETSIQEVKAAGAAMVAVGAAIYHAKSPKEAALSLRKKTRVAKLAGNI